MIVSRKTSVLLLSAFILVCTALPARAQDKISIVVKTVLASQGEEYIDPSLKDLAKELQSVFRYSSYRLLGQDKMSLGKGQTGTASLPGDRSLKITPLSTKGDRVTLKLEIIKGGRQIFQTEARLRNRSSITVGGPKYKGGYLLFNIFGSF
ncbi:hypothetical protein ACFL2O_09860 [Thermodesulfobacteriota bacterium]